MKTRPLWPILAIVAMLHLAAFWTVKGIWVYSYPAAELPDIQVLSFDVEQTPEISIPVVASQPAEKRLAVSSQLFPLPGSPSKPEWTRLPFAAGSPTIAAPPSPVATMTERPAITVFQMETRAQRVVYLIDASGSMWQQLNNKSRLDLARMEVIRSITNLPADVQFNVVFFASDAVAFVPKAVYATNLSKQQAVEFINNVPDLKGETNLIAGLTTALRMQPNSLFMLTDGGANVPSWKILNQTRTLQEKSELAAKIYAVGFDPQGDGNDNDLLLRKLTAQNGGAYQAYIP